MTTSNDKHYFDHTKGFKAFAAYRAQFPAGTMIYSLEGNELDVRGNEILAEGGPVAPFDFGKGSALYLEFGHPDDAAKVHEFRVPASKRYWMSPVFGAGDGDFVFTLMSGGATLAAGNSGIDEASPVSLSEGVAYQLFVSVNPHSENVAQRVKDGHPAARGGYILRATTEPAATTAPEKPPIIINAPAQ